MAITSSTMSQISNNVFSYNVSNNSGIIVLTRYYKTIASTESGFTLTLSAFFNGISQNQNDIFKFSERDVSNTESDFQVIYSEANPILYERLCPVPIPRSTSAVFITITFNGTTTNTSNLTIDIIPEEFTLSANLVIDDNFDTY